MLVVFKRISERKRPVGNRISDLTMNAFPFLVAMDPILHLPEGEARHSTYLASVAYNLPAGVVGWVVEALETAISESKYVDLVEPAQPVRRTMWVFLILPCHF